MQNVKKIEYYCDKCKAKGVSMDVEKKACPNCGREIRSKKI